MVIIFAVAHSRPVHPSWKPYLIMPRVAVMSWVSATVSRYCWKVDFYEVLVENAGLKYVCRNTCVEVVDSAASPFTRAEPGQQLTIPVAHNEGNYFASDDDLQRLEDNGQIAFRYAKSDIMGQ